MFVPSSFINFTFFMFLADLFIFLRDDESEIIKMKTEIHDEDHEQCIQSFVPHQLVNQI